MEVNGIILLRIRLFALSVNAPFITSLNHGCTVMIAWVSSYVKVHKRMLFWLAQSAVTAVILQSKYQQAHNQPPEQRTGLSWLRQSAGDGCASRASAAAASLRAGLCESPPQLPFLWEPDKSWHQQAAVTGGVNSTSNWEALACETCSHSQIQRRSCWHPVCFGWVFVLSIIFLSWTQSTSK